MYIEGKVMKAYLRKVIVKFFQNTNIIATAKLHTGDRLIVDLSSSVGRSIWLRHFYENDVEKVIRALLAEGDVFLDIGSNVGYFSVIASRIVGAKGEVHSFEAIPKICTLLSRSIKINNVKNIYLLNNAIYSKNEKVRFCTMKNSAFSHISKNKTSSQFIEVDAVTLDSLTENFRRVDLIKMDVEGSEMDAILGGERFIKKFKPKIIMEVQDWSLKEFGYSSTDILSFFRNLGYNAYDLKGRLITSDRIIGNYYNILFVANGTLSPSEIKL